MDVFVLSRFLYPYRYPSLAQEPKGKLGLKTR
jgi:hypothetical protein